jgi:hypothetical protein
MKFPGLLVGALAALCCLGFGRKQPLITVRFFAEANKADTDRFASPVEFRNPPRQAYVEKIPTIHERHIKAVYPFPAPDGSMGCAFQLDASGRLNLFAVSTERRGTSIVAFVSTKGGTHQVIDMIVDRTVNDGIITIQSGLTDLEIAAIIKEWPVIGEKGKRK